MTALQCRGIVVSSFQQSGQMCCSSIAGSKQRNTIRQREATIDAVRTDAGQKSQMNI